MFFFALAGLNEIVWRTLSTDAWVNFKVFGILPLTLLFALVAGAADAAAHEDGRQARSESRHSDVSSC